MEQKEYLWQYFSVHAAQRLQAFNFFLTLTTVLIGAFAAMFKDFQNKPAIAVLPLLVSILSFIFWKLDCRTKDMIKLAEEGLKELEQAPGEGPLKADQIFSKDDRYVANKPRLKQGHILTAYYTYSTCFNFLFFVFGAAGIMTFALILLKR